MEEDYKYKCPACKEDLEFKKELKNKSRCKCLNIIVLFFKCRKCSYELYKPKEK
jgi:hypothetical protein